MNITPHIGGNTRNYVDNWRRISSDPWVISSIQGIEIPLLTFPVQLREPRPICFSEDEKDLMQEAVNSLVKKNVIELSIEEEDQFVSNIIMVPKSNGKVRIILDLSVFNEIVEKQHFKMNNIHTATGMIIPNVFMSSIDLQDAYFTFPIAHHHRKFLKFRWNSELWQFVGLPMGISCAPRIFTKLIAPIFAFVRRQGGQCFPYLDDSFIFGFSFEECENTTKLLAEVFKQLGFTVNESKSELVPSQTLTFLGFNIDSTSMKVLLPSEKVDNVIQLCNTALQEKKHSVRFVAHVVGTFQSYSVAVDYGLNHIKKLEQDNIQALKRFKGNFDAKFFLSTGAKEDIKWWQSHVQKAQGKIRTANPDFTLTADASNIGWGAFTGERKVQCKWSDSQLDVHINGKELLAIFLGLRNICIDKQDCLIHIKTDNTTAMAHVNKMGGVKSEMCNFIACKIWEWCEQKNIWLYATHIPGQDNALADSLSRKFSSSVEWELNEALFLQIVQEFGVPSVDLFASRHNTKVEKYCAWISDEYCWRTDAFSFEWTGEFFYIFPPFRLAGRCWRKITIDKSKAILVVPTWPNQHWFASILKTARRTLFFKGKQGNVIIPDLQRRGVLTNVPLTVCLY